MMLCTLLLRILPGLIFLEAIDRRRIRIVLVKRAHPFRDTCCFLLWHFAVFHEVCVGRKEPMHGLNHAWVGYAVAQNLAANRGEIPEPTQRQG